MKYLIIGNKGQLGSEFEKRLALQNKNFVAVDIDKVDITDYQKLTDLFSFVKPGIVINCAAYNDVDGAETNTEQAFEVNAEAIKYLAYSAYKHHSFLIHFSSDYVFDGSKTSGMYIEKDETNPINQYGRSKLEGEKNLADELETYLLLRLSWVYGKGSQNFIYKLRNWAEGKDILKISEDEISIPTSAKTVVDVVMQSVSHGLDGLFHLTNSGYCSRYEWAKEIISLMGLKTRLEPVPQDFFKLPAKRPKFSAMSNSKISAELALEIQTWQAALSDFFENMLFVQDD